MKRGISALLFFSSLAVFLPALPHIELIGHEALEGMRLRAMLETGQWFFPEVLRKPPLYYWMSGLIAQMHGGIVDAVSLRLPSALLAGLGVLVVFRLGRQAASPIGGALGGVILLTSLLYVQHGYIGRPDMALCFFVTWSLLLFFSFSTRSWPSARWRPGVPYLFACTLALALLSKGPVGVILVLLPIIAFLCWRGDWSGARSFLQPGPLLTFGVLGCGWYISALWGADKEFWHTQIAEENVARFVGGIDTMSAFYYVGPLVGKSAPWNFLLPIALWQAFKEKKEGPVFLALWWLTVVLFFQLAAYKRARYLLPAQPASALLIGWWLTTQFAIVAETGRRRGWLTYSIVALAVVGGVAVIGVALVLAGTRENAAFSCGQLLSHLVRETPAQLALYCQWLTTHFRMALMWWGLLAGCFVFLLRSLFPLRLEQILTSLSLALLLIYIGLYPSWLAVTSQALSPQVYVDNLVEKIGPAEQVTFISPWEEKRFVVLFALQERVRVVEVEWPWGGPRPSLPTGYYLVLEERRAEVITQGGGTWTEVLRDTSPTDWQIVLYLHETDSSSPAR